MAFQFPLNPTVGQVFAPAGGPTYKWDGFGWVPFTANAIADAPADNRLYGRKNYAWETITTDDWLIGMIAMRAVSTAVVGQIHGPWLELTGQILTKAGYPRLWNWVQTVGLMALSEADWSNFNYGKFLDLPGGMFKVPSVLGLFMRVANPYGVGADFGRVPGSIQDQAFQAHTHSATVSDPAHAHGYDRTGVGEGDGLQFVVGPGSAITPGIPAGTTVSSAGISVGINSAGGAETRPANVAYRAFIYAGVPL